MAVKKATIKEFVEKTPVKSEAIVVSEEVTKVKKAPTKKAPAKKATTKNDEIQVEEIKAVDELKVEEVKKAPAKKASAKKAPVKQVEAKSETMTESVIVEFANKQYTTTDLVNKAVELSGKKNIKELNIYFQPENNKVYFTADSEGGEFEVL